MTKEALIMWLYEAFSDYPQEEVEERIRFYLEIIEDRMEEGMSEEDAVASVGSLEEVIAQIRADMPIANGAKPKRRLKAWEITLLILGFPLWLPLLISAFAVAFCLWVCAWAVIGSLWGVMVGVIVCSFFGMLAGIGYLFFGKKLTGVALLGAGILCLGLSIFLFWGCQAVTNGAWKLTKKLLKRKKKDNGEKEAAR